MTGFGLAELRFRSALVSRGVALRWNAIGNTIAVWAYRNTMRALAFFITKRDAMNRRFKFIFEIPNGNSLCCRAANQMCFTLIYIDTPNWRSNRRIYAQRRRSVISDHASLHSEQGDYSKRTSAW